MDAIGDAAAGRILDTLENASQWAVPNAPHTLLHKPGTTPLYAKHGALRENLKYSVLHNGNELLRERPRT